MLQETLANLLLRLEGVVFAGEVLGNPFNGVRLLLIGGADGEAFPLQRAADDDGSVKLIEVGVIFVGGRLGRFLAGALGRAVLLRRSFGRRLLCIISRRNVVGNVTGDVAAGVFGAGTVAVGVFGDIVRNVTGNITGLIISASAE